MADRSNGAVDLNPIDESQRGGNSTLLQVFWRRKGIMIFFALCGAAIGYWQFTKIPDRFSAGALVEVYRPITTMTTNPANSPLESVGAYAPSPDFIRTELTSDEVMRAAAEDGQLQAFGGMPDSIEGVANVLRNSLRIDSGIGSNSQDPGRTVVQISFQSGDPTLCTAAVNSAVNAYERYVNERHESLISGIKEFFQEARNSILPELNTLEEDYIKFQQEAPLEWDSRGQAVNPYRDEYLKLEQALDELRAQERSLVKRLDLIAEASQKQTSAIVVLQEVRYLVEDFSDLAQLEETLVNGTNAELEIQQTLVPLIIQEELLKRQFGENHPSVASVKDKIDATKRTLAELAMKKEAAAADSTRLASEQEEAAKEILRGYVRGLQKRQKLLNEDIVELEGRVKEVRERAYALVVYENQNNSYQRRVARLQSMLDSFDTQLEKFQLPLQNPGLQVKVLRAAGLGSPLPKNLTQLIVMGIAGGLAAGGALGWLIDWSERTFRNPDEIVEALNVEILSHMPLMRLRKRKLKEGEDPRLELVDAAVSVVHDPHSPGSESIRHVRNVMLANEDLEYQVIQVTSSMPGDGKSTIAANIGVSMAGANKRVLIVDADLRRPTQHKLFNLDSSKGVTDVLNGDAELSDVIQETGVDGLFAISTGPKPSNPAEALSMPEFGQMLDDLRTQFDLVIVDTPPILAVSDASAVAKNVDGVLFVMRIGRNSKPMAKRSITILKNLHVNVIGLVINAIGDSGYSATYATAWSNYYGGRPGGEYGYGYYRFGYRYRYGYGYGYGSSYGSDKYRNASRGQRVKVRGRQKINGGEQAGAVSVAEEE